MCQRLLVGYRLELVAICVHAMPYNYLESFTHLLLHGDSAGFGVGYASVVIVAHLHKYMYFVLCS